MHHFKAFQLERISNAPRKKHVGVDQKDLRIHGKRVHDAASAAISFSKSTTVIVSSPAPRTPVTYAGCLPSGGTGANVVNSHSPVTGIAVHSCRLSPRRCAIR